MKFSKWIGTASLLMVVCICFNTTECSEAFQYTLNEEINDDPSIVANYASNDQKLILKTTAKAKTMDSDGEFSEKYSQHEIREKAGTARFMASYFFPIFPQFYDVDLNGVWNFIKDPETIEFIVGLCISNVCRKCCHKLVSYSIHNLYF